MTAPLPGETILIHRPGHPDIRMRFGRVAQEGWDPGPGWLLLHGEILEGLPTPPGWRWQTLAARPVGPGVWAMVGTGSPPSP